MSWLKLPLVSGMGEKLARAIHAEIEIKTSIAKRNLKCGNVSTYADIETEIHPG